MITEALSKFICLYCWLPVECCFCTTLAAIRNELRCIEQRPRVSVVLHVRELLRKTNTGHLCAFVLDEAVHIWGIDDSWLDALGSDGGGGDGGEGLDVLLYPESGAFELSEFLSGLASSPRDEAGGDGAKPMRMHYVLSDGTWGEAHRLNRHVPRSVPRVALSIPADYVSLFAPLRKRTRETGVSTLLFFKHFLLMKNAQFVHKGIPLACGTTQGMIMCDRPWTPRVVSPENI